MTALDESELFNIGSITGSRGWDPQSSLCTHGANVNATDECDCTKYFELHINLPILFLIISTFLNTLSDFETFVK